MIPIQASTSTREYYVRNIISTWSAASVSQFRRGRTWYQVAHEPAGMIAGGAVRKGAGLLAALSPQMSWELNVELACEAYEADTASRHSGDACDKANKTN
mgnify:CR=1 FL=1